MSEMVEKVRAALATDQMRSTLAAAGLEFEPAQDAFLEMYARKAIEAMREPTRDTLSAFVDADTSFDDAKTRWECAIDAALSEVKG